MRQQNRLELKKAEAADRIKARPIPTKVADTLVDMDSLTTDLQDLKDRVSQDPWLVGPVAGSKVVGTLRAMKSSDYAEFKARADDLFPSIAIKISRAGARGASKAEQPLFARMTPKTSDTADQMIGKINFWVDRASRITNDYEKLYPTGAEQAGTKPPQEAPPEGLKKGTVSKTKSGAFWTLDASGNPVRLQ
jgi:hypothetical protein